MRIGIVNPFGGLHQESGTLYLFANYLRMLGEDLFQLQCNGAQALCDRDGEHGWRRGFDSCFRCRGEQATFAQWAGVPEVGLSSFIDAEAVVYSKKKVAALQVPELLQAEFEGTPLLSLCRGSFQSRFGVPEPDLKNPAHEQVYRKMLVVAIQLQVALGSFFEMYSPELLFAGGRGDLLTSGVIHLAQRLGIEVVTFQLDFGQRCVQIRRERSEGSHSFELLVEKVVAMRRDPGTWPLEIISMLQRALTFLDIPRAQLSLPIS